jgi:hypothetical protein
LSEQEDLPDPDLEWMIEWWAREYGAGVYRRDRRCGGLEQVEGVLARAVFGRGAAA